MEKLEQLSSPLGVFGEAIENQEFKLKAEWDSILSEKLFAIDEQSYRNPIELLACIERVFGARFGRNGSLLACNLSANEEKMSELLGAILMGQVWMRHSALAPKIYHADGLYYFATPDGDILQVNSNRKRMLMNNEKYELFNKNPQVFDLMELIKHYYENLCDFYIKAEKYLSLKNAQTAMIKLDPRDSKWYARRGLLLKSLGEYSAALSDLKRYLSFCPYEQAPQAVQSALIELQGLKATESFNDYSIH